MKYWENVMEVLIKNNLYQPNVHKTLNLANSSEKKQIQNIFILLLDGFFDDITHNSYNDYIDRPKLTEQNRTNTVELIFPQLK